MPKEQMSMDELFPGFFGEELEYETTQAKETEQKNAVKAPYSKAYWEIALDLVNLWARYQSVKKLYINATHEETWHRVQSVVNDEKYYNGSTRKIREREATLSYLVSRKLAEFAEICDFYGVEPVTREWLYDYLKEAKDYASYRGKCQRRFRKPKKYPAVSLKDL